MATSSVKYFWGTQELDFIWLIDRSEFERLFPGEKGLGNYPTTSQRYVGASKGERNACHPVQRRISYKKFASRHECNSKCLNGRHDGACECQCGGANHGLGSILQLAS